MRTNVNIADDAREFAKVFANANGISLGEAITELIRRAKQASTGEPATQDFGRSACGFPTFPHSGGVITTEMVPKAQHDDFL